VSIVEYPFRDALSGFFELPHEVARGLLPHGPEPIEVRHGRAALSVTLFDFTQSPVGPYRELVMALLVAPRVLRGQPLPHGAFHPYLVAATHAAARQHAIERWHLPHYDAEVIIEIDTSEAPLASGRVCDASRRPVMALRVASAHGFRTTRRRYESFQRDATGLYVGTFEIAGDLSECEDGGGALELWDHPLHEGSAVWHADPAPFLECWVQNGCESYLSIEGPLRQP
jgi:hypothetical protein